MKKRYNQDKWIKNVIGAIAFGLLVLTTGILPVKAATFTCPTFSITDTEGNAVTNESIKGKATVLIFTTNWCTNGTSTLGQLGNANWYPCPNVNVVVGMLGADKQATTEFHNTYDFEGMRFCYTETTNDMTTLAFNMFHRAGGEGSEVSTPLIFIIDPNGTVQYESEGRKTAAQLADILDDHVSLDYSIEGCQAGIGNAEFTYTGEAKTPVVGVKHSYGRYLTKGVDYLLTYENNINAGTAYAVVTGTGYAKGTIKVPFTIQPASIDNAVLGYVTSQNYTGSAITPAVTVTVRGKTLQKGTDYVVAYADNVNPGNAAIRVVGVGNYTGSVTGAFTINEPVKRQEIKEFTINNAKYKIVGGEGSKTVEFVGLLDKNKKKVTIPQYTSYQNVKYRVTKVSSKSFRGNRKINTVSIASGVTEIGASAFEGCTKLKNVTLGKDIKTIEKNAFKKCKSLQKLTIKGTRLKKVGSSALKGIHKNCKIKVPSSKKKSYQRLFKGKGQKASVKFY